MVKKILYIFTVFFAFTIFIKAQNITALASADSANYLIGDYINYTIQVNHAKDIQISAPAVTDSIAGLDLIKIEKPIRSEQNGEVSDKFKFVFSKYDSADVTIPQIPIQFKTAKDTAWQTIMTNPVSFTVHTMKVATSQEIKDVKKPIKIPLDWKFILLYILIGLIVIGVLFYLYRRYKKKQEEKVVEKKVIKVPAHLTALSALRVLESAKLWQNGQVKEYHSRITEIIRRYFSERFNLPALELTTSEAIQQLETRKEASVIIDITRDFLNNADLVKFAKFKPMSSVNEEMMKQAFEIVKITTPKANEKVEDEVTNVQ